MTLGISQANIAAGALKANAGPTAKGTHASTRTQNDSLGSGSVSKRASP
jgi:hypothetical protein